MKQNSTSCIRTFIAIKVDDDIKEGVRNIQRKMDSLLPYVRWVKPESIHVTLKFLGDTPVELVDVISNKLRETIQVVNPFKLKVGGLGVFPSLKRPKVVWVGIERSELLMSLKNSIECLLSPLGFQREERSFSPHLTIGRIKKCSQETTAILKKFLHDSGADHAWILDVRDIFFIRSILSPKGAQYDDIISISLSYNI